MGDHPGLQHSLQLTVAGRRRQQLVVLVAPRDVHLDLPEMTGQLAVRHTVEVHIFIIRRD